MDYISLISAIIENVPYYIPSIIVSLVCFFVYKDYTNNSRKLYSDTIKEIRLSYKDSHALLIKQNEELMSKFNAYTTTQRRN